jgi:hypothetical protein
VADGVKVGEGVIVCVGVDVGVMVAVGVGDGVGVGVRGTRVGVLVGVGIQTKVGVVVSVGVIVSVICVVGVGLAVSLADVIGIDISASIVLATIVSISPGANSVPTIGAFAVESASIVANRLADTSVLVSAKYADLPPFPTSAPSFLHVRYPHVITNMVMTTNIAKIPSFHDLRTRIIKPARFWERPLYTSVG